MEERWSDRERGIGIGRERVGGKIEGEGEIEGGENVPDSHGIY